MFNCCQNCSRKKSDFFCHFRLHREYIIDNDRKRNSGFTLIEVLIVVLVIGILSGTAIGSYSGAVQETRLRSATDRLQTFFQSCKDRARLRNHDVKIIFDEKRQSFVNQESTNSFLKVPELNTNSIPKIIEINKMGKFKIIDKEVDCLDLSITNLNGSLATITIRL